MPVFSLTAARDGALIQEEVRCTDEAGARVWAMNVIRSRFALHDDRFDTYDDLVAETDGCKLIEREPDPVAGAALDLLETLSQQLDGDSFDLPKGETARARLVENAKVLADALHAAGYEAKTLVKVFGPT